MLSQFTLNYIFGNSDLIFAFLYPFTFPIFCLIAFFVLFVAVNLLFVALQNQHHFPVRGLALFLQFSQRFGHVSLISIVRWFTSVS